MSTSQCGWWCWIFSSAGLPLPSAVWLGNQKGAEKLRPNPPELDSWIFLAFPGHTSSRNSRAENQSALAAIAETNLRSPARRRLSSNQVSGSSYLADVNISADLGLLAVAFCNIKKLFMEIYTTCINLEGERIFMSYNVTMTCWRRWIGRHGSLLQSGFCTFNCNYTNQSVPNSSMICAKFSPWTKSRGQSLASQSSPEPTSWHLRCSMPWWPSHILWPESSCYAMPPGKASPWSRHRSGLKGLCLSKCLPQLLHASWRCKKKNNTWVNLCQSLTLCRATSQQRASHILVKVQSESATILRGNKR